MANVQSLRKKVLLTHADVPEKVIGYETKFIELGYPSEVEVTVNLRYEGDYGILLALYNRGHKVSYKIAGRPGIIEFKGEFLPELEQFCKTKHKTELTLDKVKEYFDRVGFKYGNQQGTIQTILDKMPNTDELEVTYKNLCMGLGFDPKPFRIKQSDIEDFNSRLGYIKDNRKDRNYVGDDIKRSYNWKGEYEEHLAEPTEKTYPLSSYNSYCKKTYNIASPEDVCIVLGYTTMMKYIDLPEDVYICECGYYAKYRTADVEWDNNNGRWRSYPDRDVCCPHCGALRLER